MFVKWNHLGSVRAVVSGVKTSGNATIVQLSDYHDFGMTMQGRSFVSATGYRFGYQGSEKDKEINAGAYTTDFRGLDVRLGRWLSPDPITHASWSPYVSMNDNPIGVTDVMGLEGDEGEGTGCGTDQGSSSSTAGDKPPGMTDQAVNLTSTPSTAAGGGSGGGSSTGGGSGGMSGGNGGGYSPIGIFAATLQSFQPTGAANIPTRYTYVNSDGTIDKAFSSSTTGNGITTTTTMIEYNSLNSSADMVVNIGVDGVIIPISRPPSPTLLYTRITKAPSSKAVVTETSETNNEANVIEINRQVATNDWPPKNLGNGNDKIDLDFSPIAVYYVGRYLLNPGTWIEIGQLGVSFVRAVAVEVEGIAFEVYNALSIQKIRLASKLYKLKPVANYLKNKSLRGIANQASWIYKNIIKPFVRHYSDDIIDLLKRLF